VGPAIAITTMRRAWQRLRRLATFWKAPVEPPQPLPAGEMWDVAKWASAAVVMSLILQHPERVAQLVDAAHLHTDGTFTARRVTGSHGDTTQLDAVTPRRRRRRHTDMHEDGVADD
jgi:hypothetical protein